MSESKWIPALKALKAAYKQILNIVSIYALWSSFYLWDKTLECVQSDELWQIQNPPVQQDVVSFCWSRSNFLLNLRCFSVGKCSVFLCFSGGNKPGLLILREAGFHRVLHSYNCDPEEWMVSCVCMCFMSMNVQWDHCLAAAGLLSSPWDGRDVVFFSLFKRRKELCSNEEGHSFWLKILLPLKMNPIHEELIPWLLFYFTEMLGNSIWLLPDFFYLSHWNV